MASVWVERATLDSRCGAGRITRWLSSRVALMGQVVALDADAGAVAMGRLVAGGCRGDGRARISLRPGLRDRAVR